jgi:hypothetical protein
MGDALDTLAGVNKIVGLPYRTEPPLSTCCGLIEWSNRNGSSNRPSVSLPDHYL